MIEIGIPYVEFVAVNTDAQALARSEARQKVQLGPESTRSLGAGGDPKVGKRAAEESRAALRHVLEGAEMVFVAAGMGGGTGTGAAPVVARLARETDALTIAVVTTPFSFEGTRRLDVAMGGVEALEEVVDALIVVSNDRLLHVVDERVTLDVAFRVADEMLRQGVQGISELVTRPGLINLDFADVRTVMRDAGRVLMSIGHGDGADKAIEAAHIALQSPLLDTEPLVEADRLLVNVTGGEDLTLAEVKRAMEIVNEVVNPQTDVFFGTVVEPRMRHRAQVTLVATGLKMRALPSAPSRAARFSLTNLLGEEVPSATYRPHVVREERLRVS
jgi:cell division protein FtsZ